MPNSLDDLYNSGSIGKEISLRDELEATFDGTSLEIDKAQDGIIRSMRRDSSGTLIPCVCVHPVTKEPEKDRFCAICLGEAYLWDEVFTDFYKVKKTPREVLFEPGLTNVPLMVFYMRYNTDITKQDKIIQIILDAEGVKVSPVRRKNVFRIHGIEIRRLDSVRTEALKGTTYREDVKFLNV